MAKRTISQIIRSILKRKTKRSSGVAAVSQKYTQQFSHRDNPASGARKKSLREKWQAKREEAGQKRNSPGLCQEKSRKSGLFRMVLVAGVLLGCGLMIPGWIQYLLGDVQYFRVHDIEFSGCVVTNARNLRKFSDISYEMNMLTIDTAVMEARLEQHPWVKDARVRRVWPDRLVVAISEHHPQALVARDGEKGFFYLNREGETFAVVQPGQDRDFPVITGLENVTSEAERQQVIIDITKFLKYAGWNDPNLPAQNVSEIHCTADGELIVYLVRHPFPIYLGKGDMKRKYYQLRKVLEILYRKKKGKVLIESIAYIRMDYQEDKVLVATDQAG